MKINSFSEIDSILKPSILSLSAHESYSLERMRNLVRELGNPQNKIKIIHVAGTSGKSSTSYYIAELLRRNGYLVGLSSSPHIEQMNERLQINLVPLEEKKFCAELSNFLEILSKLSVKPTYFELFTAFAFWYFAKIKVDYAVMEVGLGGLLDATNVVDNYDKICVITDIGLDHTDILGMSLPEVTKQKAGIIQPGNQVFTNRQSDQVINEIKSAVNSNESNLTIVEKTDNSVDLAGFQKRNWQLAKTVSEYIFDNGSKKALLPAQLQKASKLTIPGRLEKYQIGGKQVILDGAHNEQKMQALIDSLVEIFGDEKFCVIIAIGSNKKQHLLSMTRLVSQVAGELILTTFDTEQDFHQKSLNPSYLAQYFAETNLIITKSFSVEKAIDLALSSNCQKILITGSLYLVGRAGVCLKQKLRG